MGGWLPNLGMVGKGTPVRPAGALGPSGPAPGNTFTRLSCNGTPGRTYRIDARLESGTDAGTMGYYFEFLSRAG